MGGIVEAVVAEIGTEKNKAIPILQAVQNKLNYLPSEALKLICELTDITPVQISGITTFYSQFRHLPTGEHIVKVCTGTACHVKGATLILDAFKRELKISEGSSTSDDKLFSVEEVACLGCCTLAPVVQIDDKTYGHATTSKVGNIIKDFLNSEKEIVSKKVILPDGEYDTEIRVGLGSCCIAGGSRDIMNEVEKTVYKYGIEAHVKTVGCVGVCNQTPLLEIAYKNKEPIRYTNLTEERVSEIILHHIKPKKKKNKLRTALNNWADTFHTDDMLFSPVNLEDDTREKYLNNFLQYQKHIATEHYGLISPFSYDEYLKYDGFKAFNNVITLMNQSQLIDLVTESGLRGRGGGGFITGEKWKIGYLAEGDVKYIICNGDEGDPGAFMDRMLLESFPFRVIEGMMIAAYAIGAKEGIFYIRAEYPLAVDRVKKAIKICEEKQLLGDNIMGSGFSFRVKIFEGAGAFVCGEETAMIASIQGDRGNPVVRPPFPIENGLYGKPTLVNNVETLCMIPWIIRNGPEAFNSIGTANSKGTKVFALAGKIARGGLIEVPMGITIRKIVEKIGEGVAPGRKFKAVQIGGPSGGCIPESLADTPVDFEMLTQLGAMMGSGGLVVLDDSDCMVDMAKYFLSFTHNQSCGKCTFCRVGTGQMLRILNRFSKGEAEISEIDELEKLCISVKNGSLCGLGSTAPNPVLTSIKYFREEYEAHANGVCPTGSCPALITYRINDNCIGCTICVTACPVNAIEFKPYEKHHIDTELCVKCDSCVQVCTVDAIEKQKI
ncbi:MAG: NAD(P)H-dependent oxidoreductase subunit E [Bacteroidetes bacterium]|nr:NAD(P)H-dependent oxidoreductase subunit E [Bacteroidota bacterium]MBL6943941.1 NAD(P)H-dependent oxidoreductase subunit E [Bacteroidales bacterium]